MLNLNPPNLSRLFTIALSASMLMFGGLLLPPGSPTGIPAAHATDEADGDEGEESEYGGGERRTVQIIGVLPLLEKTQEEIDVLMRNFNRHDNYVVTGFSQFMSNYVLYNLSIDTEFMKEVLRRMRSAITEEERKRTLKELIKDNYESERIANTHSTIEEIEIIDRFLHSWLEDPKEGRKAYVF